MFQLSAVLIKTCHDAVEHCLVATIYNSKGVFCLFVDRQQHRRIKVRPPLMVKLSGRVRAAPGEYL